MVRPRSDLQGKRNMIVRIRPGTKERIRPQEPESCTPAAWQEIILASNARPERVVLKAWVFDEVARCHMRLGCKLPDMNPTQQGKYVVVARNVLYDFMKKHGAICK